jgi:hypothetical protein
MIYASTCLASNHVRDRVRRHLHQPAFARELVDAGPDSVWRGDVFVAAALDEFEDLFVSRFHYDHALARLARGNCPYPTAHARLRRAMVGTRCCLHRATRENGAESPGHGGGGRSGPHSPRHSAGRY